MELKLSQLVEKDAVLQKAFMHPAVKVTPRTKNKPGIEQANKVVMNAIEFGVIEHCASEATAHITESLETHALVYGERADADDTDAYDTEVDELIEAIFFKSQKYLSADWLGRNTIDCELHEEGAINRLALSYGKEIYKQLAHGKTQEQIMDEAGILDVDVQQALHAHLNQTPEEKKTMANDEEQALRDVAAKMRHQLGDDFDMILVSDDIDSASDDEEALALGALQRLGLDAADGETLQSARLTYGIDDLPDTIFEMMKGAAPAKAPRKTPVKGAAAKKAEAAKKVPPAAIEDPEIDESAENEGDSSVPATVLQALSEYGGVKDADIAAELGLSRPTYNNYRGGKGVFEPSVKQFGVLRNSLVQRIQELGNALRELDRNPEPFEVE